MNITLQGIETHESLNELKTKLIELHSIYFIKRIVEDDDLSKRLNLKEKNFELFESFIDKIIQDTIEIFYEKTKTSPLKKQIAKELDLLIKDLKNRYLSFGDDLNDDFKDPFSENKYWKNPKNDLWKFYSIVHFSNLDKMPFILSNLKTSLKQIHSKTKKIVDSDNEIKEIISDKRLSSKQILLIIKIFKKCGFFPKLYDKSAEQRLLSSITGLAYTSFRDNNDFVDSIIEMTYPPNNNKEASINYINPIESHIISSHEETIIKTFNTLKEHYSKF